jgi:hypothetical protein
MSMPMEPWFCKMIVSPQESPPIPSRPIKALTSLPLGMLSQTQMTVYSLSQFDSNMPKVTHVECISFHCNQNIVPEMHPAQ